MTSIAPVDMLVGPGDMVVADDSARRPAALKASA